MTNTINRRIEVAIRWMIRRDMKEVLAIENEVFQHPWCEDEFVKCLRQRHNIALVAERGEAVVGFVIYELHQKRLHIINIAVDPLYQHQGVGGQMIRKLQSKLAPDRRTRIMLEVRETNLGAQLFLRAMGFRAISLLRDHYEDTDEDAYLFQYRYVPGAVPLEGAAS